MCRREYLSSVVNVLTNSVKISEQTKADFAQLNLPQIHGKIGKWWSRAPFSIVCNQVTHCLPNGFLKQDFLDV